MAVIKAVSSHAPISVAIDYVEKREKTEARLLSGIGVSPETAKDEMESTKELYGKTGGRTYKHFVQSFAPGEGITPDEAHKVANEFAEKCEVFKGFEVLVATHQDREHVHTHFIVNSVSYEDGHKFQMSSHDLQDMKDLSDSICREHGLSICEKGKTFDGQERTGIVAWTKEKYQYLQKVIEEKTTKAYVRNTADAVKESMQLAKSKEEFISALKEKGYEVDWQDKHKHITFTDPEGHKVRDTNLNKTFNLGIGKGELEQRFEENSVSPVQEQLSFLKAQAVASDYRLHEYRDAKREIDKKIHDEKIRIEVTVAKYNTAAQGIKSAKAEIKGLTAERDKCSPLQVIKKHDLQEQIEHANTLIESIRVDRDEFLERYGFDSVDEMKEHADDFYKAEKLSDELERKIHTEQSVFYSFTHSIHQIADGNEEKIDCSEEDLEQAKEQLREEFGRDFSEEKFERAEISVSQKLSHHGDSEGGGRSALEELQERKEEVEQREQERTEEEHHEEVVHRSGRSR